MAERTVRDCDKCGAEHPEAQRLNVAVGSELNGVETVTDWRKLDLCPKCLGVELQAVVDKMPDAAKWVQRLRKKGG